MKFLSEYLLKVISAAAFCSLVRTIAPTKGAGRVVRFSAGLVLILCVVAPVLRLDADQIVSYIAQSLRIEEEARTGLEIPSKDLTAELISRKMRTYVLDKADELGAQIEVEVSIDSAGAFPYPDGIKITGSMNAIQRQELERYISNVLAIPADRQVYNQ